MYALVLIFTKRSVTRDITWAAPFEAWRKPNGVERAVSLQEYVFLPLLVFVVNGAVALYMMRRLSGSSIDD